MDKGKQTCELLKSIRVKLAEANGIDYQPHECTHEGPCPGTCPLCDQELQLLQQQLEALEESGADVHYDVLSPEEMVFLLDNGMLTDDDEEEPADTVLMGDVAFEPLQQSKPYDSPRYGGQILRPDDTEIADTSSDIPHQ